MLVFAMYVGIYTMVTMLAGLGFFTVLSNSLRQQSYVCLKKDDAKRKVVPFTDKRP